MIRNPRRRTFRALTRLFAQRLFDTELMSVRGEISSLLGQLAALLCALSFVICVVKVPQYAKAYSITTAHRVLEAAWSDQEFLISTAMALVGVFTLLLWDGLFPDVRDCLILSSMPVRPRTMFRAKVSVVAGVMSLVVLAVNSFTGMVYPFMLLPDEAGAAAVIRYVGAYWIAVVLGSAFVFCTMIAIQGIAIQVLPHAVFLRWSSLVQCALFFGVLTLYFLMPPLATPQALASAENRLWYACLPSYWFLGLFQTLIGSPDARFHDLAARATTGTGIAATVAALAYVLAYARQMRRTVEQSGIVPSRRRVGKWTSRTASALSRVPAERALLSFIFRTLARSRQHRLLIALYAGMGFAYVSSGVAYVMYHNANTRWENRTEKAALEIPLLLTFFLIVGLRVAFSIPVDVKANWLFRLAGRHDSGVHLAAARKALWAIAVCPIIIGSVVGYSIVWPWDLVTRHVVFVAAVSVVLVELALGKFNKTPFTCAYLPGKSNLKIRVGAYFAALIGVSELTVSIEQSCLRDAKAFMILMVFMAAGCAWAMSRGRKLRAEMPPVSFEDMPEPVVATLGLSAKA